MKRIILIILYAILIIGFYLPFETFIYFPAAATTNFIVVNSGKFLFCIVLLVFLIEIIKPLRKYKSNYLNIVVLICVLWAWYNELKILNTSAYSMYYKKEIGFYIIIVVSLITIFLNAFEILSRKKKLN